ncbi:MAG: phosphoribosylformylglycinamidine cyclo-ligase, partial [Dehalococcoidia bacterium]
MKPRPAKETYAAAGVDLEAGSRVREAIKKLSLSTLRPEVLSAPGLFAGLFELKGRREPALVASCDGVGTKIKVASAMGRHDTIGVDLVHHCVNDILTLGAEPLFLLDYIAMGKLIPRVVEDVVAGVARACRSVGCALIGGETAEMPDVYGRGDYELVGFIIGVVEKGQIIDGSSILPGDSILGLPSSGLHTNGYSLVRRVFHLEGDASVLGQSFPELGRPLGEELLEPHRCYYPHIKGALPFIKGMAHITGGGLVGNIPRILPPGVAAFLHRDSWPVPAIFSLVQKRGGIDEREMFRVFNMGIGM